MHPQTHTSPNALLTLTSEPTRTVDAAHPIGYDDWIIEIRPNGFHTHPSLLAPKGASDAAQAEAARAFIDDVLEDRTVLIVRSTDGRITHVARFDPGLHPLETAVLDERTRPDRPAGETTTFRVWSGRVLATIPSSP